MALRKIDWAAWLARAGFAVVFGWNVVCALQFVVAPESYMGAYQLSGAEGVVALRGLGVAFLMWNATYPLFIVKPRRWPVLGGVIVAQQVIGLVGESIILAGLPVSGFALLSESISRFIAFDATGLVIEVVALAALWATRRRAVVKKWLSSLE